MVDVTWVNSIEICVKIGVGGRQCVVCICSRKDVCVVFLFGGSGVVLQYFGVLWRSLGRVVFVVTLVIVAVIRCCCMVETYGG